jgi:hypothetical protein
VNPTATRLTKRDAVGAVVVLLLVFLSTFPVVVPFIFIGDACTVLRASHAIAVAMLFLCGRSCAGLRPWATRVVMIVIGSTLVGVGTAFGGLG